MRRWMALACAVAACVACSSGGGVDEAARDAPARSETTTTPDAGESSNGRTTSGGPSGEAPRADASAGDGGHADASSTPPITTLFGGLHNESGVPTTALGDTWGV